MLCGVHRGAEGASNHDALLWADACSFGGLPVASCVAISSRGHGGVDVVDRDAVFMVSEVLRFVVNDLPEIDSGFGHFQ